MDKASSANTAEFTVKADGNIRLDLYLTEFFSCEKKCHNIGVIPAGNYAGIMTFSDFNSGNFPETLSRSAAAKLIDSGFCQVNGKTAVKSLKLKRGDRVSVTFPEPHKSETLPEEIPLSIVYEDDDFLVINKPKGLVVHPSNGHRTGTLVNALLGYCGSRLSGINGELRPGIVHRIDKDTSGLMLAAKNDFAHNSLAVQIKSRSVKKIYETVVIGNIAGNGEICVPLGRSISDRKKQAAYPMIKTGLISSGVKTPGNIRIRNALTSYKVIENFDGAAHLEVEIKTGRTHQIRVHMSHINRPVLGDSVYGGSGCLNVKGHKISGLEGQCLHSKILAFNHPRTGERIEFSSQLPEYFESVITQLRKYSMKN